MVELDLLDKKILFELDLDSRLPVTQLAKKVRASKETVNFRLKKLVDNGYIKNFITTIYTSHLNQFYYKLFYGILLNNFLFGLKTRDFIFRYRN